MIRLKLIRYWSLSSALGTEYVCIWGELGWAGGEAVVRTRGIRQVSANMLNQ